jgi:hypothetical protein
VEDTPAAAIPAEVVAAIEASPPSPFTPGYEVDELSFATSNFGDHPELAGRSLPILYQWDDPSDKLRRTIAGIIERYIRPRVKTGGRLIKHARYFWLLLAEGHLTQRLFGAMVRRIWAVPLPAG